MTALIALLLAAAQGGLGFAQPGEISRVSGHQGLWRMQVFTKARTVEGPPRIGYIRCTIRRPGLLISLSNTRWVDVQLGGAGTPAAEADIVAVALNGIDYEASRIIVRRQQRYNDVVYPPDQAPRAAPAWTDIFLGVRRDSGEPWLALSTLIDDMLDSPGVTLRYRAGSGTRRLTVPLAGLRRAIGWCDSAMNSDRARRLNPR